MTRIYRESAGRRVKKSKRLPITPRSRVRSFVRQLWLRSRERAAALKRTKYCCEVCGVKQSRAKGAEQKVEVHHANGIQNWEKVIDEICKEILIHPDYLQVLCPECHEKQHKAKTSEAGL